MKPRGVKNDLRELTRLQFHLDRGGLRIENEESPHGRQHQLALTPPRLLTSRFLDATLLLWITVLDSKHVSPSCSSFVIATSHLAPTPTLLLLLLRQPIARVDAAAQSVQLRLQLLRPSALSRPHRRRSPAAARTAARTAAAASAAWRSRCLGRTGGSSYRSSAAPTLISRVVIRFCGSYCSMRLIRSCVGGGEEAYDGVGGDVVGEVEHVHTEMLDAVDDVEST